MCTCECTWVTRISPFVEGGGIDDQIDRTYQPPHNNNKARSRRYWLVPLHRSEVVISRLPGARASGHPNIPALRTPCAAWRHTGHTRVRGASAQSERPQRLEAAQHAHADDVHLKP
mmetsp:Transcript_43223/g.113537  ORF Transcript_43223/g.113537 Transcript_43223/m.113537 type:complete len:116 (-) Transcript_43223:611-958(-)